MSKPKMATRRRKPAKSAEQQDAPQSNPIEPDAGPNPQEAVQSCLKAAGLLALAAISSPISQLSLSPVYGSIPPSAYHFWTTAVAIFLAWVAKQWLSDYIRKAIVSFLPVMAFLIPAIQYALFQYSGQLGPAYGPLATELLTYFPSLFISMIGVTVCVGDVGWKGNVGDIISASASYGFFIVIQRASGPFITRNMGSGIVFTRSGLQFIIATFYALLLPSKLVILAVLPLLHSVIYNPHMPLQHNTNLLNATLHAQGYSLVARQESLTGYISVLDNVKDGFRVLRCDHSLLGGEWLHLQGDAFVTLREPIYAIFVMLEAVRLVVPKPSGDAHKHALVIGMGVGITPSAFVTHGIHTTTVEIDPVVHEFALKYFGLRSNQRSLIEDAVTFVERAKVEGGQQQAYHYIVHDVFTGGAEPAELFTKGFLQGLSRLLQPTGVIAINYAGDLRSPSAGLVVRTVKSVFPSCRLFREDAGPSMSASSNDKLIAKDFTNMVMFCRKVGGPFVFRDPEEGDFLNSQARRHHLLPKHEIDASYFDDGISTGELGILKRGQTQKLEAFQKESAVGHWRIMRTVLPDIIWESW